MVPNTPFPRLLDMGQCNDAYGAVVVASALAKAFNTDVNGVLLLFKACSSLSFPSSSSFLPTAGGIVSCRSSSVSGLPLSFAISWFEQKAVAVLLTLLHLGVKNIALGPNLPVCVLQTFCLRMLFVLGLAFATEAYRQAFVTPKTAKFLSDNLGLRGANVAHVEKDLEMFLGAKQ